VGSCSCSSDVPLGILAGFSDLDYNKVLHNRICGSPVFIREPTLESQGVKCRFEQIA
jgi:hypothetical protein